MLAGSVKGAARGRPAAGVVGAAQQTESGREGRTQPRTLPFCLSRLLYIALLESGRA